MSFHNNINNFSHKMTFILYTVELSGYPSVPGREIGEQDSSQDKFLSYLHHMLPLVVAATDNPSLTSTQDEVISMIRYAQCTRQGSGTEH